METVAYVYKWTHVPTGKWYIGSRTRSGFGKIQSDEWKLKNSIANSGKPKPQLNCPHCGVTGGTGVMSRWHFNNCKQKKD